MARKIAVAWAAEDTEAALHARYRAEAVIAVRTRLHGHCFNLVDIGVGLEGTRGP